MWNITDGNRLQSCVDDRWWVLTRCEVVWADEGHRGTSAPFGVGGQTDYHAPVATLYRHHELMTSMSSVWNLPADNVSFLRSSSRDLSSKEVKIFGTKDAPHPVVSIPAYMLSLNDEATSDPVECTMAGKRCRMNGEVHQAQLNWSLRGCAVAPGSGYMDGSQDVTFSGYVNVLDRASHRQSLEFWGSTIGSVRLSD